MEQVGNILDATPGIGYVTALVHRYLRRNPSRAKESLVVAIRASVVASLGVLGYLIGGPYSSMGFSVLTGLLYDGIRAKRCWYGPGYPCCGLWSLLERREVGDWFDAAFSMLEDGLAGLATAVATFYLAGEDVQDEVSTEPTTTTSATRILRLSNPLYQRIASPCQI